MEYLGLLCPLFMLALFVVAAVGAMKVFTKAGQPAIAAFIPIYNTYVFVIEIAKKDMVWFLLSLFIPFAVIVPCMDAAEKFGKDRTYGIGMGLLPFIFFPMLGFSDAKYRGGSSKRAMDLDDEEEEEEQPRPKKKKRPADDEE